MADNCVCAKEGEYHLRSDHRHNGDDCLAGYDERCSCKKFRLGERIDVATDFSQARERIKELEGERDKLQRWIDAKCTIAGCWKSRAEQAEARERALENALDLQEEAVESSIWNLEQCLTSEDSHCNDVTRVHDRLLRQREELAALSKEREV